MAPCKVHVFGPVKLCVIVRVCTFDEVSSLSVETSQRRVTCVLVLIRFGDCDAHSRVRVIGYLPVDEIEGDAVDSLLESDFIGNLSHFFTGLSSENWAC